MTKISTWLPFLRWFPLTRATLQADLMAGVTVALILVPQSMAYAQLAGLPVVYGLYAAFVPVIVASLWGSSNQLHTGPVAMLSLMSAAAVMSFATPGTTDFIQLSIMLALMVGVLRVALGVFKLGAIVNLLSSPVIVGFTNAAALIIGLSQLNKVIGVPFPRSDSYMQDLWQVLIQLPQLHWWTLAFAAGAWLLIIALKKFSSSVPAVLIAVGVATLLSAMIGYEDKISITREQIHDSAFLAQVDNFTEKQKRLNQITQAIAESNRHATRLEEAGGLTNITEAQKHRAQIATLQYEADDLKQQSNAQRVALHAMALQGVQGENAQLQLFPVKADDATTISGDGKTWRFESVNGQHVMVSAGGAVVGSIPQGLPDFGVPVIQWELLLALLPAALVMALIGFMEATSISKAIATNTGDRVNTSKELIGQGLANIVGSFFGSYAVSGSFSRSAVAARSGARTGLFAIISALAVVAVLLFFTAYLYHLPQAVLAVIVMMAVFSLIRVKPLVRAWQVDRLGAVIGLITFIATLLLAPAIADGILLGIGLTILHFLIQTMKPRVEVVSRKADGTVAGIRAHRLQPISEHFVPVRFDGSLVFVNVAYFEDMILEALADFPNAKTILVVGSGINQIDASGEEKIREVADRLRTVGVNLVFSSLKNQVLRAFENSGLVDYLGRDAFFSSKETALQKLGERFQAPSNSSTPEETEQSQDRTMAKVACG